MNIIFAKHDALNKEYLFEVPEGMHPVNGRLTKAVFILRRNNYDTRFSW